MKKVTNLNLMTFCIGMLIGMFVIGLTKPTYKLVRPVYTFVKPLDRSGETNPIKVGYYEHLARTQP